MAFCENAIEAALNDHQSIFNVFDEATPSRLQIRLVIGRDVDNRVENGRERRYV